MTPELPRSTRRWLIFICVAGLGVFAAGAALSPTRSWAAFLTAAFTVLSIAMGASAFLALNAVGKAGWCSSIKRVPEALAGYVTVGAATILALLPGVHTLYHWSHHEAVAADPILKAKAPYLNFSFFAVRMVVVLALWIAFIAFLRRESHAQDRDGDLVHTRRSVAISALYLFVLGITFSMASFDWLMSLEPHWFSTIFGMYQLSGMLVAGVAGIAVTGIVLKRHGLFPQLGEAHLHDLGKLAFGFATFWGYLWFSQYLLIWYANIPEETAHYVARTHGGWSLLFYGNLVVNWLVPFLLLLPAPAKKSERNLLRVGGLLLFGRWLDTYLMVGPATMPEHAGIGPLEIAIAAGLGALFVLTVARALRSRPLVARHDPYLVEGLHHHG